MLRMMEMMLTEHAMHIAAVVMLVVNYGISYTMVLQIPKGVADTKVNKRIVQTEEITNLMCLIMWIYWAHHEFEGC